MKWKSRVTEQHKNKYKNKLKIRVYVIKRHKAEKDLKNDRPDIIVNLIILKINKKKVQT